MKYKHDFVALLVVIASACVNKQGPKGGDHFPTYEQIRGNKEYRGDFVSPPIMNNGDPAPPSRTIWMDRYWNAFNYPKDSVTYFLNGRQAKSAGHAKKELDTKGARIERVSVGAVDEQGMREIEIDYTVPQDDQ